MRDSAWASAPSPVAANPRPLTERQTAWTAPLLQASLVQPSEPTTVCSFNFHPAVDELPEEQTVGIEINGRPVGAVVCSPIAAREMAVGWAFTHGYFSQPDDLKRITVYPGRISLMVEDPSKGGPGWSSVLACAADEELEVELDPVEDFVMSSVFTDDSERNARWRISKEPFLGVVARVFNRFEQE